MPQFKKARRWEESCDYCESQEGGHYCLLHSLPMKNMDLQRCDDWTERQPDIPQRIVGPDVPPTDDAQRWERSKSPWHADAFPDGFKGSAPEQGDRKTGWLEIDWCGNAIGWVPDGTVIRPNTGR